MRVGTYLLRVVLVASAGCTTVSPRPAIGPGPDTARLYGMVTDRREVAAGHRWVFNEDFIVATSGAVGLFIARMGGTPRHYLYTLENPNGSEFYVPSTTDIAVGTCLDFFVPKEEQDQFAWRLEEVGIKPGTKCLEANDSAYDVAGDQRLDANGNTALHNAIWHRQTKRALRVIEKRSVNLNSVNRFGATALHLAVANEDLKVVQALLNAGADVNIRDNDGDTPAKHAAEKGNPEIVDLLKRAGAGD